jgi:hypothetical protein
MLTKIKILEIDVVLKRTFVALLALGITLLGTDGVLAADSAPPCSTENPLVGGWKAENYYLKNGSSYHLLGQILFTSRNWTVLFIVVKDGKPQRGSGEGGDYTVDGNKVVFTHHYVASTPAPAIAGLKEQPARALEWEPSHAENSTFDVQGDRLTLFMPSGNRLTWTRSSY